MRWGHSWLLELLSNPSILHPSVSDSPYISRNCSSATSLQYGNGKRRCLFSTLGLGSCSENVVNAAARVSTCAYLAGLHRARQDRASQQRGFSLPPEAEWLVSGARLTRTEISTAYHDVNVCNWQACVRFLTQSTKHCNPSLLGETSNTTVSWPDASFPAVANLRSTVPSEDYGRSIAFTLRPSVFGYGRPT